YIPQIDWFAWILQTNSGNYVLAFNSPNELDKTKGKTWAAALLKASMFGKEDQGDFPEVSIGDHFLYLSFQLMKSGHSVGIRISLERLREGRLFVDYFHALSSDMRPVQNTGDTGYFAAKKSSSELRLYAWPEHSSSVSYFDVGIATIPEEDFECE